MSRWSPRIASRRRAKGGLAALVWLAWTVACSEPAQPPAPWSQPQLRLLRSLSLLALPEAPESPTNRVATDPRAARLGQRLFFDPGLSANGEVACASCHVPALYFTDGRPTSQGLGSTRRNAPSVVGAVYSPWLFWDGRRDSLWAQALSPLESAAEMGNDRLRIVRYVTRDRRHAADYRGLFGPPPDFADPGRFPERAGPSGDAAAREAWNALSPVARDEINRAFSNVGKAIAAYERLLLPGPARFDHYVERLLSGDVAGAAQTLSEEEVAGLRLFVDSGRTQCLRCHNGPLLTNHSFHAVASSRLGPVPDLGRFIGIQSVLLDVFNCLGPYSDAPTESCGEIRFLDRREIVTKTGAFKTPSLRGVGRTAPYFHDGSLATLDRVIEHYRRPPPDPGSELTPLVLTDREVRELVAFLETLSGDVATPPEWLIPPPGDAVSGTDEGA